MVSWFNGLSIRSRIVLFGLLMLLPALTTLLWLLANDVRLARNAANDKVQILATGTAADVRRVLDQSEALLRRLAQRPQVRALDPRHCDATVAEVLPLNPGDLTVEVRDAHGNLVCSLLPAPDQPTMASAPPWFDRAQRHGGFMASDVAVDPGTGKRLVALSYPIRNGSGTQIGLVILALDLLTLNRQLLAEAPVNALLAVVDRSMAVVLRSREPETYIGTRPLVDTPDPSAGGPEGIFENIGRDGELRLFAYVTLPSVEWKVFASLPRAEVVTGYEAALKKAIAIGIGAFLLAVALAWRLSAVIANPISNLRRMAARIAAGEQDLRAEVRGPPDIRALALQFNRMLESKAISDARLHGIFETAVDAIIIANEQQVIVQANPAAAKVFQCPADQMVGSPLDRFIPQRHRAQHRGEVTAFGAGAADARHMGGSREVMALRMDGDEFPIEASISHLSVDGQQLYTVIHRDITERSRARQELVAGKLKLEAALSSMTDAVLITDSEGRFQEFNEAFARFHRFKDIASCKRTLAEYPALIEMFGPNGAPVPLAQWPVSRALRGESATDAEYRLRRRDTDEGWLGGFSFAPIRSTDGAIIGSVVVARDITAVKLAQADLHASHAALQRLIANQDKVQDEERSRIARELHDDLQQTLAAIRIDLGVLGDRLQLAAVDQTALIAELDNLAAQAIVSTRRIVNDLRPRLLEELGIVPALQVLVDQFGHRAGVACILDADEAVGAALVGLPAMEACLFRVAQEALNNVGKHAQASRVQVRLAAVSPTQVSLSVVDDGRGIRARDRRNNESFGILGMQERVRALGGVLRIEQLAGGGTLLETLLPLGRAAGPSDMATPGESASGALQEQGTGVDAALLNAARTALAEEPLPRLLSLTVAQALQRVIDAMAGSVAVLDSKGIVRFVNRGWIEFAEHNGQPGARGMGPGVDYLAVCRAGALADASVEPVLLGLTALIEGRVPSFDFDYPCHSPRELRWFRMNASPMADGDFLITHFLTAREDRPPVSSPP